MNSPPLGVLCKGERVGLSESFQVSRYNLTLTGKNGSCIFQGTVYTPVLLWVGSLRWGYGRNLEFGLVLYPLCRGQPSLGNALLPQNCPWHRDAELVLAEHHTGTNLEDFNSHYSDFFPQVFQIHSNFRKIRSILNPYQCRKTFLLPALHSSLALSLQIFFQGCFFLSPNNMLFIKKKTQKSSEMSVSVRHRKLVWKTFSKNTGMWQEVIYF